MKSTETILFLVALLLGVGASAQQPVPVGSEFQVNTYTTDEQLRPSAASQPDGGFVIVWESRGSSGTDTDGNSVQGQRYMAGGVPAGNQFQVNTFTTSWQSAADVGTDSAGNFVVVWHGPNPDNYGGGDFEILGQLFAANGVRVGDEFRVNSYSTGFQRQPDVAVAPDGSFVVVWESEPAGHSDHQSGIVAQRFAADATPLGNELQVNTYTTEKQMWPTVAIDADGKFVAVWQSDGSSGSDADPITPTTSIQGQRFSESGDLLGGEFQVNSYTTDDQFRPDVAMDTDGDFVVVWESDGSDGPDTNTSTQGQRFAANGSPQGGEFQVNSYIFGVQKYAQVAMASGGSFVVVWQSTGSDGGDGGSSGKESVQMRRFSADGRPVGEDLQVNTFTLDQQWHPTVSVAPGDEIVVAWESNRDDPAVYYRYGIRAQRFEEDLLLSSGLEFGDLSDWSFTIP